MNSERLKPVFSRKTPPVRQLAVPKGMPTPVSLHTKEPDAKDGALFYYMFPFSGEVHGITLAVGSVGGKDKTVKVKLVVQRGPDDSSTKFNIFTGTNSLMDVKLAVEGGDKLVVFVDDWVEGGTNPVASNVWCSFILTPKAPTPVVEESEA